MQNKSVLIAGSKEVDKRIFVITFAEFLATQNHSTLILTKSFNSLPEPLHGRYRDSEDYACISLRYPQTLSEVGSILFDFTLFRKLSKGPFTIIVENIDNYCNTPEQIARLASSILGATPYHASQIYPKLIVTQNTNNTSLNSTLSCLFDSIWETDRSGKEVFVRIPGRESVSFEELELAKDCPQKILRLKSILLSKIY